MLPEPSDYCKVRKERNNFAALLPDQYFQLAGEIVTALQLHYLAGYRQLGLACSPEKACSPGKENT